MVDFMTEAGRVQEQARRHGSRTGPSAATADPAGENVTPSTKTAARPYGSRAPLFIKRSRLLHLFWRIGVFFTGLAVVGAGIILLPLPGPGWVVIFAGVAIWAGEFTWAQAVLRWTKRKVTSATQQALRPEVRRRNIALTAATLVTVATVAAILVVRLDLLSRSIV